MELLCEGFDPALTLDLAYVQNGDKVCILSGDRSRLTESAQANGLTITESLADVGVIRPLNEKDDEDGDWKIDDNARFVVEGPYQRWGVKNANQRVYPKELFEDLIGKKDSYVLACLNERRMLGHLEHPSDGRTNLKEVGIVTTGLTLHPNKTDGGKTGVVRGRSELLETPNGQILRALSKAKIPWGVSSRGRGSVSNEGMVKWSGRNESDDFQLQTFDAVSDPSTPGARPTPVKESTKGKLAEAVKPVAETVVSGVNESGHEEKAVAGNNGDVARAEGRFRDATRANHNVARKAVQVLGHEKVLSAPHEKIREFWMKNSDRVLKLHKNHFNESLTDPDVPEAILNSITKTAGWVREGDTDFFRNPSIAGVRAEVQGVTAVRFVRESVNESGGADSLSIQIENRPYELCESLDERAMSDAMEKSRPAYSKRDDGDPMEPLAKQYIQYIKRGNSYEPAGDIQLKENLGRHAYRIGMSFSGPVFTKVKMKTDELYHFKDACTEAILKEIDKFWGLKEGYEKLGIRHARGILTYGGPGNGKSSMINQVVEQVVERGDVVFYTKAVEHIAPCLKAFREVEPDRKVVIVLEDADGYINYSERELLNLMDGEEMFEGVLYLATTNYIDRFPPRLLRPGRFDKKIKVPPPTDEARATYLHRKLKQFDVSEKECARIAKELDGLSFGHLKEYIASVYAMGEPSEEVIERLKGERHLVESADIANDNFAPLDESVESVDEVKIGIGDKQKHHAHLHNVYKRQSGSETTPWHAASGMGGKRGWTVQRNRGNHADPEIHSASDGKYVRFSSHDAALTRAFKLNRQRHADYPETWSPQINESVDSLSIDEAEKQPAVDLEATLNKVHGMPYTHDGIHGHIVRVGKSGLGHRPSATGRKSQAYLKVKQKLGDHWHTDFTEVPDAVWKHAEKAGRIVMKESVDESVDSLSIDEAAHTEGKGTAGATYRAANAVKTAHGDSATILGDRVPHGVDVSGESTREKTHEALKADGWQAHRSGFDPLLGDSTYFRHPAYKTAEVGVHAMNGKRPIEGIHRVLGHKLLKPRREPVAPASESHIGFKKLTARLRAKGVQNPAGLAAWIGRKKFGKAKFQRMAAAGHHHESVFREVGATRLNNLSESFGLTPTPDFSKRTGKVVFEGMADADGNLAAFSILTPKGVSHFVSVGGKDMNEPDLNENVIRIVKDSSTGEHVVKMPGSTEKQWSYHDDKQDAIDTAHFEAKRQGIANPVIKHSYKRNESVDEALDTAPPAGATVWLTPAALKHFSSLKSKDGDQSLLSGPATVKKSNAGSVKVAWGDKELWVDIGDLNAHNAGDEEATDADLKRLAEAIENPNSSGQGHDPDHDKNEYHAALSSHGYKYSHSTPVTRMDGSKHTVHTYAHGHYGERVHRVSVFDGQYAASKAASGRYYHGRGVESLNKFIKGHLKRTVGESITALNILANAMSEEDEADAVESLRTLLKESDDDEEKTMIREALADYARERLAGVVETNDTEDSLSVDETITFSSHAEAEHHVRKNGKTFLLPRSQQWRATVTVNGKKYMDYGGQESHAISNLAKKLRQVHGSNESVDSLSIDDTLTTALRTAVEERDDAFEIVDELQSELDSARTTLDELKSQVKISESSEASQTAKDEQATTGLSETTDAGRETGVTELPASVGTKMRPTVINDYVPPKAKPTNTIDEDVDASVGIYRRWNRKS